jgi:hypothetical protein
MLNKEMLNKEMLNKEMLNKEMLNKEMLDKEKERRKGGKNYIIFTIPLSSKICLC